VGEAAPDDPDRRADLGAGAGEHQQRRRRHLAHLRERGALHAGDQEGLRHRHEVRRSVAGAQRGLVQRLDQGRAAGREGEHQEARATGDHAYELGKKSDGFFLEGEVKKTLEEWKKKKA